MNDEQISPTKHALEERVRMSAYFSQSDTLNQHVAIRTMLALEAIAGELQAFRFVVMGADESDEEPDVVQAAVAEMQSDR